MAQTATAETISSSQADELRALDSAHLLHPQHLAADVPGEVIFARGEGALIWDVEGRRYYDGLSSLWNVNVGHGRKELADAAAQQLATLAFANPYSGSSTEPAIRLAAKLAALAPGDLNAVFFTTGGGESNESAFKIARSYWSLRGRPEKVKILSRDLGYHGAGIGPMAAIGMPIYWQHFGPLPPGFGQVPAMTVEALEQRIVQEGPETVAAFIAEPVQGAGGVYVPPADYFPRVRELCDRYDVLFIADEVITGFGRTGRYWGVDHWGVVPDLLSFAKGVTSGYVPLGGVLVRDRIKQVLTAPEAPRWMHAYTYSAHPTCCAVALRNLALIEREGLVARAAAGGERLLAGLAPLRGRADVAEVRGLGLMAAVEFREGSGIGPKVLAEARRRGLFTRARNDILCLAPPLVTTDAQIDEITSIVRAAVDAVAAGGAPRS